jgi:2-polyprenyl-3-methyl-5-hydroxy-6-metoxy-1,4-benzoquinol methylase
MAEKKSSFRLFAAIRRIKFSPWGSAPMTDQSDILLAARHLYNRGALVSSTLQTLRPYICPFEVLIRCVPVGSRVLDVGCGSGLLLGLLSHFGRISSGHGFDLDENAIRQAKRMARKLPQAESLVFERRNADTPWPTGEFDVVTMIDVMHHVNPSHQDLMFQKAASRLRNGGILIYKDMAERPLWMAWANRLHDLVLARQWIHYFPLDSAISAARDSGFELLEKRADSRLWYAHELLILQKTSA